MNRVIGIDIGTTNSCVAVMENGQPTVIPNTGGYKTTPSMFAVSQDGKRLVGHLAKRQAITNSKNTIFASKRLIGRRFDSPEVRKSIEYCPYEIERGANDDPRFNSLEGRRDPGNAAELGTLLMTAIQSMTTKECIERMVEEDVPVGPVLELDQLFDDEQILHNDAILEFDHPTAGRFRQARPAARFDKTPQDPHRRMPPLHGEHTEEVLRELGLDDAAIGKLRGDGVIPTGE